jgi:[ribosomal protein S5]-alanine N-acetyltransferase
VQLTGPTLTLRYATLADAPALFALASDPEVTRWFSWGPYVSVDEPLAYIARLPGEREHGERLDLIVDHSEHGPIGVTGLAELSRRDRRAMVGTWLGREHWGTGANAASKGLVFQLAFATLGLERLGAYAEIGHLRSQRALTGVGFSREGVLRAWHRHPDGPHDVVVFGLLREEWRPQPGIEVRGAAPAAFVVA